MTRAVVDEYLYFMDRAFYDPNADDPEHALLKNLNAVSEEQFLKPSPGGGRTIVQMAWHVAACKFMYANHGFEDGTLDWPELFSHWEGKPTKSEMIDWLTEAHLYLRRVIEPLSDADLSVERKAPFGVMVEARWLIANAIEHDLYHAGEINLA